MKKLFAIAGSIVVLWQLLAPGYVLTLDMVFGPHVDLVHNAGDLWNAVPASYALFLLNLIFGGWIAEKILLVAMFFLLFYLPLHFFRKIFDVENTHGAEYVASLVFAVNPFVYERFLAGQWAVLFGYALLMPFTAYLTTFCHEWNHKNGLKLLGMIMLIGFISIHILIISLIVTGLALAVNWIGRKFDGDFLKRSLLLALAVLICSSYWLLPAFLSRATPIVAFGPENWGAFRTAGGGHFGTLGNVLSLHGFWGEHEVWITRFLLPKDGGWLFWIALILLASVVITGIYAGLKDKRFRGMTIFAIAVMCLSAVFSCGVGTGIFQNFNIWIFEHISFWKGFRDSEKWSVLIALGYAILAGLGSVKILSYLQNARYKRIVFYVLLATPIIYTPNMLFGFSGELKAVDYPASWAAVNDVLRQDKDCRALFLPWHEYYSLKFNDDILTANPSRDYFDCDIVQGRNMELGTIASQGGNGAEYDAIEKSVTDNGADPGATIDLLKQKGIRYVIFSRDLVTEDDYKYPFITSKYAQKVINNVINRADIDLYSLY